MEKAGRMRDRAEILSLQETADGFVWKAVKTTWAHAHKTGRRNLFSSIGAGREEYAFTLRRQPLTLCQALRWRGQFCFLSDLQFVGRAHLEVKTALVEPSPCSVQRTCVSTDNCLNRPQVQEERTVCFPAILTEKYQKIERADWQTVTETGYVLVAPKAIALVTGEVVTVDSQPYVVCAAHTQDSCKNEYELVRRKDA